MFLCRYSQFYGLPVHIVRRQDADRLNFRILKHFPVIFIKPDSRKFFLQLLSPLILILTQSRQFHLRQLTVNLRVISPICPTPITPALILLNFISSFSFPVRFVFVVFIVNNIQELLKTSNFLFIRQLDSHFFRYVCHIEWQFLNLSNIRVPCILNIMKKGGILSCFKTHA